MNVKTPEHVAEHEGRRLNGPERRKEKEKEIKDQHRRGQWKTDTNQISVSSGKKDASLFPGEADPEVGRREAGEDNGSEACTECMSTFRESGDDFAGEARAESMSMSLAISLNEWESGDEESVCKLSTGAAVLVP